MIPKKKLQKKEQIQSWTCSFKLISRNKTPTDHILGHYLSLKQCYKEYTYPHGLLFVNNPENKNKLCTPPTTKKRHSLGSPIYYRSQDTQPDLPIVSSYSISVIVSPVIQLYIIIYQSQFELQSVMSDTPCQDPKNCFSNVRFFGKHERGFRFSISCTVCR